jgi:hypothetical protein
VYVGRYLLSVLSRDRIQCGGLGCCRRSTSLPAAARSPASAPQATLLFEVTRVECLAVERYLRPRAGIGWNRAKGGAAPLKYPTPTADGIRRLWDIAYPDD